MLVVPPLSTLHVVVQMLPCHGIDVNQVVPETGATPLDIACNLGHTKVVMLLLACDLPAHTLGWPPLPQLVAGSLLLPPTTATHLK
jgi:hypothetical protein